MEAQGSHAAHQPDIEKSRVGSHLASKHPSKVALVGLKGGGSMRVRAVMPIAVCLPLKTAEELSLILPSWRTVCSRALDHGLHAV
jgi:hypothetical protein